MQKVMKPPRFGGRALFENNCVPPTNPPASSVKHAWIVQWENRYAETPDILQCCFKVDTLVFLENCIPGLLSISRYWPRLQVFRSMEYQHRQVMRIQDVSTEPTFLHSCRQLESG